MSATWLRILQAKLKSFVSSEMSEAKNQSRSSCVWLLDCYHKITVRCYFHLFLCSIYMELWRLSVSIYSCVCLALLWWRSSGIWAIIRIQQNQKDKHLRYAAVVDPQTIKLCAQAPSRTTASFPNTYMVAGQMSIFGLFGSPPDLWPMASEHGCCTSSALHGLSSSLKVIPCCTPQPMFNAVANNLRS